MKNKSKKQKRVSILGTFNLGEITVVDTEDYGIQKFHDEASVTIVLETTTSGQSVRRMLSGDTDVCCPT